MKQTKKPDQPAALAELPADAGALHRETWDRYIAPLNLDVTLEPTALLFVDLWVRFRKDGRLPSPDHGHMRCYMAQMGMNSGLARGMGRFGSGVVAAKKDEFLD